MAAILGVLRLECSPFDRMMTRNVLQIIACYLVGFFVGTPIWVAYSGGPLLLSLIIMMVGAVLALPILLLVVLTFVLLRKRILKHLALWCVLAPVLVVAVWILTEWQFDYWNRGFDLYRHLSLQSVWEQAALAFTCASIASFMFWCLNRTGRRLDPKIPA